MIDYFTNYRNKNIYSDYENSNNNNKIIRDMMTLHLNILTNCLPGSVTKLPSLPFVFNAVTRIQQKNGLLQLKRVIIWLKQKFQLQAKSLK